MSDNRADVQLTRDHVPVIYHDFLVGESGADIAPHSLTQDQFMCISDMQRPATQELNNDGLAAGIKGLASLPPRSQPFDTTESCRTRDFLIRISHTHEFKGNIRGTHIHDSFTTLEEMLRAIPETVAFDNEPKYPTPWEAEDWNMNLYGMELNFYTNTILAQVYEYGGKRPFLFTSFSPELYILASHKQSTYPVMFFNESNLFPTGDVRASSLQEAIQFARHLGLPEEESPLNSSVSVGANCNP